MFYDRLNELCKENGTTISVVSTRDLHCSNSTATGWKKGASPNSSVVIAAAELFNVSTDYLLGLTDIRRPTANAGDQCPEFSEDELFLLEKLRNTDTETGQRAMICALVVLGCSPERDQLPSLRNGRQKNGGNESGKRDKCATGL